MAFDFKAKIGPLPAWTWGAIAGGAGLVGYYFYSRSNGGSEGESSSGTSGGGGGSGGGGSNLDALGYQTSGIKGGSATTETTTPESNQGWLARVSRAVADSAAASPSEVYGALYKYITGQDITTKEKAYVDKAIKVGMSPPEGTQGVSKVVDPVTVKPPVVTPPVVKPPVVTPPVVKPPVVKPPATTRLGYIRRSDGEISVYYSDGTRMRLSYPEWEGLGKQGAIWKQIPDNEYNAYKVRK